MIHITLQRLLYQTINTVFNFILMTKIANLNTNLNGAAAFTIRANFYHFHGVLSIGSKKNMNENRFFV